MPGPLHNLKIYDLYPFLVAWYKARTDNIRPIYQLFTHRLSKAITIVRDTRFFRCILMHSFENIADLIVDYLMDFIESINTMYIFIKCPSRPLCFSYAHESALHPPDAASQVDYFILLDSISPAWSICMNGTVLSFQNTSNFERKPLSLR